MLTAPSPTTPLPLARRRPSRLWLTFAALLPLLFLPAPSGHAAPEPEAVDPEPAATAELDGDAIYERVLENRFNSYTQALTMKSGDRGGNFQEVRMSVDYLNVRGEGGAVLSKTIAKYESPQDVRHLGYLVINKKQGPDDQFIYRPSARRVRRINLRGEAIAGTDFALEDVLPQEFEDGSHERLPDTTVLGIDCHVVKVVPTDEQDSEYSHFVVYSDKEHHVPVRTEYFDEAGVKIKLLEIEPDSIASFEDVEGGQPKTVWLAQRQKVTHLKLESWTELQVQKLTPNPGLKNRDFSQRRLTASH